MHNCESYIVRIYRRDEKDPSGIIGLVEVVQTREVKKFMNLNELGIVLGKKTRAKKQRVTEGGNKK